MANFKATNNWETIECNLFNSFAGPVYEIPALPGKFFTIMGVEEIGGLPGNIIRPTPHNGAVSSTLPERHAKRTVDGSIYWAESPEFSDADHLAQAIRSGDALLQNRIVGYYELTNIPNSGGTPPVTIKMIVRYWELLP